MHCEALVLEALTHQILECSLSGLPVVVVDLVVGNFAQALPVGHFLRPGFNDRLAWLACKHSAVTRGQLYQSIDNWSARSVTQQKGAEVLTIFLTELTLPVYELPALKLLTTAVAVASEVTFHNCFAAYTVSGE